MLYKKNTYPDYDLLAKYFAGEASTDEISQIENWISSSEENKEISEQVYFLWTNSLKSISANDVNVDAAWQKMQNRISANTQKNNIKNITKPENRIKRILQIAAVIILALVLNLTYPIFFGSAKSVSQKTENTEKQITLADNSQIYLNKNSEISYPEKFNDKIRKVKLKGQAFFKISPDSLKPFIVETQFTKITVLGTEFNVEAFDTSKYVKVTVVSGKVKFESKTQNNQNIILKKGEAAVINTLNGQISKQKNTDTNKFYSQTKTLIFKKTELHVVAKTLSYAFNTEIKIENTEIKNCRLTATFKDASLQQILEVISNTFSVKIKSENNIFILSGKSCQNN